jgi:uncharacterized DUF497 family protein
MKCPWGEEPLFEWDDANEEKIRAHGVSAFDVEECFENPYRVHRHKKAKSQPEKYADRYVVFGETNGGRKLVVILQHKGGPLVRPITAWDC